MRLCEALDGPIIAIQAHHLFVVRKADRWKLLFQSTSESRLPDGEVTVD